MNRDEILLAVYNKKVKSNGNKIFSIWDNDMQCNIPVSSHIAYFIAEDYMDKSLKLNKVGIAAVAEVMKKRMNK
jgi:hypothetical protein